MYTLNEYQADTVETAVYPGAFTGSKEELNYLIFGLVGEAGEIANAYKKTLRKGIPVSDELAEALADELGDVLWYAARLAEALGKDLSDVALNNREKLRKRADKKQLKKLD